MHADNGYASITRESLFGGVQAQIATASAGTTPTVSQLLNASNTEYLLSGTPAGMSAFMVNGAQLQYTNTFDGVAAKVWLTNANQVVIAYQGTTGGLNLLTNPLIALTQIASDLGIYAQQVTPGERDSLSFAKNVMSLASSRGIASSNVFVTGHSLGGIEAEYVAQQTGLGGVAFESTGIPASTGASHGTNFVNVVTYGDPVGNYASDISGMQPFAPSSGLAHYGQVVMVGNKADQTTLHNNVAAWGQWWNPIGESLVLPALVVMLADFHLPGTQAHDLGVTLSPYNALVDGLGVQSSAVFSVGSDSISQLISAASGHGNLIAHGVAPSLGHIVA